MPGNVTLWPGIPPNTTISNHGCYKFNASHLKKTLHKSNGTSAWHCLSVCNSATLSNVSNILLTTYIGDHGIGFGCQCGWPKAKVTAVNETFCILPCLEFSDSGWLTAQSSKCGGIRKRVQLWSGYSVSYGPLNNVNLRSSALVTSLTSTSVPVVTIHATISSHLSEIITTEAPPSPKPSQTPIPTTTVPERTSLPSHTTDQMTPVPSGGSAMVAPVSSTRGQQTNSKSLPISTATSDGSLRPTLLAPSSSQTRGPPQVSLTQFVTVTNSIGELVTSPTKLLSSPTAISSTITVTDVSGRVFTTVTMIPAPILTVSPSPITVIDVNGNVLTTVTMIPIPAHATATPSPITITDANGSIHTTMTMVAVSSSTTTTLPHPPIRITSALPVTSALPTNPQDTVSASPLIPVLIVASVCFLAVAGMTIYQKQITRRRDSDRGVGGMSALQLRLDEDLARGISDPLAYTFDDAFEGVPGLEPIDQGAGRPRLMRTGVDSLAPVGVVVVGAGIRGGGTHSPITVPMRSLIPSASPESLDDSQLDSGGGREMQPTSYLSKEMPPIDEEEAVGMVVQQSAIQEMSRRPSAAATPISKPSFLRGLFRKK